MFFVLNLSLVVGLVSGTIIERSLMQTLNISRGYINGLWESPLCPIMWGLVLAAMITPPAICFIKPKIAAIIS